MVTTKGIIKLVMYFNAEKYGILTATSTENVTSNLPLETVRQRFKIRD